MFGNKYSIIVERVTTETTEIEIEANDEEEANDKAINLVENPDNDTTLSWELEDTNFEVIETNPVEEE